ncbi:MAG: hypothetical protein KKD74_08675 [Bacteroidetes bacterium]|nr:hypothetical protein [Bacteroidota bacterium]
MMKCNKILLMFLLLGMASCKEEPADITPGDGLAVGEGFFVLNQGNFTLANASLSFYSYDSAKMSNYLFYKANGAPLGDVAQSMTLWNDLAFIVMNNSGLIYIVDAQTIKFKNKISGLQSPRYVCIINDHKAYVSDLQQPGLTIIDPTAQSITGQVNTGKTVENMVLTNNKVFAANWSAYYQQKPNNTLMVIDPVLDTVTDSVQLVKEPNSMVVDKNGMLWVLCSGGFLSEERPALFKINTSDNSIVNRYDFSDQLSSPTQLVINKNKDSLYYLNNGVYRLSIDDNTLPETPLIPQHAHVFYALEIDPGFNRVVVSDALNYVQDGFVYRYSPNGTLIDSLKSGIIPGQFIFN